MDTRVATVAALALTAATLTSAQEARFTGEILVRVHEIVVRVLGPDGRAVPGLDTGDFAFEVDGEPLTPTAVEWFGPAPQPQKVGPDPVAPGADPTTEDAGRPAPGRVLVLFFQLDMHRSRLPGLVRMSRRVGDLIRTLSPADRAAVVVLDSHLELRLDFTADQERLLEAVLPTSLFGPPPHDPSTPDEPSLLPGFDPVAAREVYYPESAMKVVADALDPIPGAKSVVFVGWGMGRLGRTGVRLEKDYAAARRALSQARTSVFTLDVTDADFHSLEVGLQQVAGDTGGFYARTHELGWGATVRLQEALSGFYLVAFPCPDPEVESHTIEVHLRDRRGTVLAPPRYHHGNGPG